MKFFYSSNLKIFTVLILFFPAIALGQATFSGNMNKVDGASEQTKNGLIKKCNEKNDCTGVINKNIFGVVDEEILFVPLPKITELPSDLVEEFALIEIQKHIMNSLDTKDILNFEIPVWNTTNVIPMGNMFEDANNFNLSLHSSHNNTPLSNLDGLQIQSKQKTNTEDEINQNASVIKNENKTSQVQTVGDIVSLKNKIQNQTYKLGNFLTSYKSDLLDIARGGGSFYIFMMFQLVEGDLSELEEKSSNGNYDKALYELNSLTEEIEDLILDLQKSLVDRGYIDENDTEKFNSIQNKFKSNMSEARSISSDLVSESKNYSSLNTKEYERNIEAFDQSKKIELKNDTLQIEKDISELESSLMQLLSDGIIDSDTLRDLMGNLSYFDYHVEETSEYLSKGILEDVKERGINMLFYKTPGRDSVIEMIEKSPSLALLEKKSKNNPKIEEFLNKFSNLVNNTQKLAEDIIKEDENIQNKIANNNLNNPITSSVKASGNQLTTDDFKEFLKNNSNVNAVEVGKLIIAFSKNQTNENYQKIIQYLNTVDGFKDFQQSVTAQGDINLDEIKKLIDDSGLTLDDLKEFLLSNKNVDLSKIGILVNEYSKDKSLKNFAEAIKYLQSIEGFDKFINDKIDKKEEAKKELKDKSIADLKEYLQRIDFFIIENLGNEKSEQAIKLSEQIIEGLSSGKVDKIIELKEVANNYLADQEVVEREEIPLSENTNELASMTDVSTNLNNEDTSQASDQTNEAETSNNQMVVQMTGGDGTKSYGLFPMNENEKKTDYHVNNDEHNTVTDKNIQKDEYSILFRNTHRHLSDTISHLLHHKLHEAHEDGLPKEYIRLLRETLDYYLASSDEMEKELEILLKIYLNDENGDLFNNKDVLNYFINTLGITIVDISTMRVIEDIILNLVERGIIDRKEFQKLIENFENYKRFRFASKNNNNDEIIDTIIGMPDLPGWMADGLTDEEKESLEKKFKKNFNNLYILDEIMGGGPNSYPKLINYYENRKIINIKWGANWRRYWDLKNKFVEKAKEINSGVGIIKESNENIGGENHHHNEN